MEIKYDKLKCKDCKHKDYCKYAAEAEKVTKHIETEILPIAKLDSFFDIEYKCKFFEDKFATTSHVYLNSGSWSYPNTPFRYNETETPVNPLTPADPLDPWRITCSDLSPSLQEGINQLKNNSN